MSLSPRLASILTQNLKRICGNGLDSISEIGCQYSGTSPRLPVELREISERHAEQIARARARGDVTVWNGLRFRLLGFQEGRTSDNEEIVLMLTFDRRPSHYSDFTAMDEYLEQAVHVGGRRMTRREYCSEKEDATARVGAHLLSDVGISLLVVSSDNYLVLTKRREDSRTPRRTHVSTHESMIYGKTGDVDNRGIPDPVGAAVRSAREELGIQVDRKDIEWVVFDHDRTTWEYHLFGVTHCPHTWEEIKATAEVMAKDYRIEHTLYAPPVRARASDAVRFLSLEMKNAHQAVLPHLFYAMINISKDPEGVVTAFETLTDGTRG